jgi:hypothetical protein
MTDVVLNPEIPVPLSNTGMQTRNGVSASSLAELGARAGALGLEAHTVNRIVARLQEASHKASLDTLDAVLAEVQSLLDARLNTIVQEIRGMQATPSGVSVRDWLNGRIGVPMIPVDQVLNTIARHMGVQGRR